MDEHGRLQINLLGKPEVWLDGVQLTNFSTAKTEALLYYLAATGQIHSRETLAGLLWGEMPEAKARRNLTKSLTVLRRLLEPFLLIEPQRVGFDPEAAFGLDVNLLETACIEPDEVSDSSLNLTSEAINCYRGDFLDGFFVKDAPAFEAWTLTRREGLREMALGMLERLIDQAVRQKTFAAGIEYGRRLLELDPWRESAHRQLMLLLARQGQYAAALTQYEQCCQVLADELGVDPMPATTALCQRIRDARQKHSFSLPHEPTPLVGREQELNQIQERLSNPNCRLLTITGLGGMGKTRLAIAAAHQANQETALLFLNGVAFVSLAGVTAATAVPLTLANALGVPLSSATTPRHALLHFLQNREMLLVLDNLEHLTGAADLLLELLQTCPDVKLLVTSRVPLNLASEWRLDLDGLPIPPDNEHDVDALQTVAAVSLFVRCASQMNPQFRLTAVNASDVSQLCRLVAGIPLALQLAAAWLPAMSIAAILSELERDLDILATDMQDIPPRQRSMRAVFDSAWHHLSSEERSALAALSLCRGGFTQAAAKQIASANPFLLRRLINRALIYQQDEARYDMHPLTRQFAREQLDALGNEETAMAKHGRFFLTWLLDQAPALQGMTPQAGISAIKSELANVQQAWAWALQTKQMDLLLHSLTALATFYDVLGLLQEGEALTDSALAHLEGATTPQEERLLCHALVTKSQFLTDQGQYEAATETLKMAQALSTHVQDQEVVADICHINGRILTDTGKYSEAEQQFQQAISIYRHLHNERKTARSLSHLGWNHIVDVNMDTALPLLQEALTLERKIGHKWGEAFALGNLAVVYGIKGETKKALAIQQKVLVAYEDLGDLLNSERAENNYGMSLVGVGRYREALPHIRRAVELARQLGAEASLTNALDSLGAAYLACGEYEKAKVCLEEALDSALKIGYVYMNYSVRAVLARLFNRTGQLTQAAKHLQKLHRLASQLENGVYIARALAEQAYLANAQGNLTQAIELMAQAIDILRQNPSPLSLSFFLLQQADYLAQQQRPADALPLVQEALTAAQQLEHTPLQMRAAALTASLSFTLGEVDAAQSYAETVKGLLPQLEPYPDVLEGLLYLCRYWLAVGDSHAAAQGSTLIANHPASAHVLRLETKALLDEMGDGGLLPQETANGKLPDWTMFVATLAENS